jgi:ABC-type nitrate/sulfonate/bicarbonate transport system permease component
MATAGSSVSLATGRQVGLSRVTLLRGGLVVALLLIWELVAASGLLFQDVVPSFLKIGAALFSILADPSFYRNLGVTAYEVALALVIGGSTGLVVGILLGGSRFLASAFEHYLYYLGPAPKIIFFPIMIMWFGVGPGSKTAMGALSCFFPVALSAAAGMREIDRVLIRVGRSFRANTAQMVTKIYLPAMRAPMINGLRLGFGIAIIGVLLAETKLSSQGVGSMIIQAYTLFNMPRMYALLIIVFTLAALINAGISRLDQMSAAPRR